ncbi:unnamed protein product [Phaedon cochleariae]|uniref:Uncharacterized protein n=1 Tax=Phaedon cochleariae TaxID=80249 RepID=A0A9P0D8G1_PHACE|nr:unnamed protein product [Phaedon cochleariae]
MNLLAVFSASFFLVISVSAAGLKEEFAWTRLSYAWPSNGQRVQRQIKGQLKGYESGSVNYEANKDTQSIVFEEPDNFGGNGIGVRPRPENQQAGASGNVDGSIDYQYENNIPMGANVWRNKLFITVPRRRLGVPSTLNYVRLDSSNRYNVPLIPYPNWNINIYPDTSGAGQNFVSVYRVAVDACDRLWFIDTGLVEIPGNATQVRPTTLVIIDLNTDQVIHSYVIPADQLRTATQLASLTIDIDKTACGDAYAYIPDLGGYGLIVYSLRENRSWRITHNYFYLEPTAGEFFISGHNFQWNDGVFSVELTAPKRDGYRTLYFHSMAGTHMYKVSTRILRNETLATRSYHENDFRNVGDRGTQSQTSCADIHKPSGVMFLGLVNQNALACWNTNLPLSSISSVQRDDRKMIYPCDVKVHNDNIYVLTNAMPEFLYGRLNYDEVNFRVWSNTVEGAIQGTACSSTTSSSNGGNRAENNGPNYN